MANKDLPPKASTEDELKDTTTESDVNQEPIQVTADLLEQMKNSIEGNRLVDQPDESEEVTEPTDLDSEAVELTAENSEESSPVEEWSNYLFQQRRLRELGNSMDRREAEHLEAGGSEADFKKKIWSHYRDALLELGIITEDHKESFNPSFTRDVVRGARELDRSLQNRKKELGASLASDPQAMDSLRDAITRRNKRRDGATVGDVVQERMPGLLNDAVDDSAFDAHLTAGDYSNIYRDAQELARDQRLADAQGAPAEKKPAVEASPKQAEKAGVIDEKVKTAIKAETITALGEKESLLQAVNDFINDDRNAYLEDNKSDPKAVDNWSFEAAAVTALTTVEHEGAPIIDSDLRNDAGLDDEDLVGILKGARKLAAQNRKEARKSGASTTGEELGKAQETPKSKERPNLTPDDLFDDVRVDRMGELLYSIDNEKLKDAATEKGEKLTWKEAQQQRLAVLESFGMITPEQAKEYSANLKGVGGAFNQAYAQWNDYKKTDAYSGGKTEAAQTSPIGTVVEPGGTSGHEAEPPIIDTDTIVALRASIADSRHELGLLADKNDPKRWELLAKIQEAKAKIEGIEASETDDEKSARFEEEKVALQAELDELEAQNPNHPKRWELLAQIRSIEESLDAIGQAAFDKAYNSAAQELNIDTAANDRSLLESEKATLQAELDKIAAANPNDPKRWELLSKIRSVEKQLNEHDGAHETDEAKRTRLTTELNEFKQKLAQIEAANPNDPERWQVLAEIRQTEQAIADLDQTTEPSQEEYKALYDSLKDEYDGMTAEQKNSAEGKQLRERLNSAHQQMLEADGDLAGGEPKKTPEQIRGEVSPEKLERLKNALTAYAEIRARNEHREEGIFRRFGRKGRETELREAAKELREAKLAIEYYVVERKAALGLYEGNEAAIKTAKSDELFEGLLTLDEESRAATLEIHANRAESRNGFQKFWVGAGTWLTKGGKVKQVGKQVGVGAGLGVIKGGILAVTGATIPVSAVIGAGAATVLGGVRYGVNKQAIDASRAGEKSADGKVARTLTDDQITKLKSIIENNTRTPGQSITDLAEGVLQSSERNSKEQLKKARAEAAKVMGFVGAGMALGGVGTFLGTNWLQGKLGIPDIFNRTDGKPGVPAGDPSEDPYEKMKEVLKQTKPHDVDARSEMFYPEQELKGNSFFVEPGNGPIKEIQQLARLNGHPISMGEAESIYDRTYEKFGDKLVSGGPEYHGPNGDLRFGESGKYRWGKGVAEDIVKLAAK